MLIIRTVKSTPPGFIHPIKSYEGDAGWDVRSIEDKILQPGEHYKFKLGFKIIGQPGKVYLTQARSSYAINYGINVIGNVIDNGYRGEVSVILQNSNAIGKFEVKRGDKIAQILIQNVDDDNTLIINGNLIITELSKREEKGYGSTNEKNKS